MSEFSCSTFEQFEQQFGAAVAEEVLTRICEAGWDNTRGTTGLKDFHVHRHDAVNHTYTGILEHGGVEISFVVDNGDWGGTEVREFTTGEPRGYLPPEPTKYALVPNDDTLRTTRPAMYSAYLYWTGMSWFIDLQKGYNYDRFVQPGLKVEQHYREQAAQRGLKFVTSDHPAALLAESDAKALNRSKSLTH